VSNRDPNRLPEAIRHGVRGEPTGRDLPTELELEEAGRRAALEDELREHEEPRRSLWARIRGVFGS
jgi:hypothetical protein